MFRGFKNGCALVCQLRNRFHFIVNVWRPYLVSDFTWLLQPVNGSCMLLQLAASLKLSSWQIAVCITRYEAADEQSWRNISSYSHNRTLRYNSPPRKFPCPTFCDPFRPFTILLSSLMFGYATCPQKLKRTLLDFPTNRPFSLARCPSRISSFCSVLISMLHHLSKIVSIQA